MKRALSHLLIVTGGRLKSIGNFLLRKGYRLRAAGSGGSPDRPARFEPRNPLPYYVLEAGSERRIYRCEAARDVAAENAAGARKSSSASYADAWVTPEAVDRLKPYAGKTVAAYADGSADKESIVYSWAVVFDTGGQGVAFSDFVIDTSGASCGLASAELTAALVAVRLAREAGLSKLVLYYDYKGVDPAEDMTRNSKKPDIVAYRQEMAWERANIKVVLQKVKSKRNKAHKLAYTTAKNAKVEI